MAREIYVQRKAQVAASTTAEDVVAGLAPTGGLLCLQSFSAVDHDNDVTLVTFGFKAGATEYLVGSVLLEAAQQVANLYGPFYVYGNFRPFARFVGATAGDKVEALFLGYLDRNPVGVV